MYALSFFLSLSGLSLFPLSLSFVQGAFGLRVSGLGDS